MWAKKVFELQLVQKNLFYFGSVEISLFLIWDWKENLFEYSHIHFLLLFIMITHQKNNSSNHKQKFYRHICVLIYLEKQWQAKKGKKRTDTINLVQNVNINLLKWKVTLCNLILGRENNTNFRKRYHQVLFINIDQILCCINFCFETRAHLSHLSG